MTGQDRAGLRLAWRVVCGCGESALTEDPAEADRLEHKFRALHPEDGPVKVWTLKPVKVWTLNTFRRLGARRAS